MRKRGLFLLFLLIFVPLVYAGGISLPQDIQARHL